MDLNNPEFRKQLTAAWDEISQTLANDERIRLERDDCPDCDAKWKDPCEEGCGVGETTKAHNLVHSFLFELLSQCSR